jgi:hypothetical protein
VISSKHPAFAKIATKLDRAAQELGQIDDYLDSITSSDRPVAAPGIVHPLRLLQIIEIATSDFRVLTWDKRCRAKYVL